MTLVLRPHPFRVIIPDHLRSSRGLVRRVLRGIEAARPVLTVWLGALSRLCEFETYGDEAVYSYPLIFYARVNILRSH